MASEPSKSNNTSNNSLTSPLPLANLGSSTIPLLSGIHYSPLFENFKHHPLPLDLLPETTTRDGQTPDLILKTLRCARLCSSVRADLPFSPTEPLGPGGRDSNPPLALGSFGEASHTPTSKFVALKVIKIGKQTERNLLAHA